MINQIVNSRINQSIIPIEGIYTLYEQTYMFSYVSAPITDQKLIASMAAFAYSNTYVTIGIDII